MIATLPIGAKLAAQIIGALALGILKVVFAVTRGLPDIHHGAGHARPARQRGDPAVHQRHLTARGGVLDDTAAEGPEGGSGGPEGTEDGGGCRAGGGGGVAAFFLVVFVRDFIDEADQCVDMISFGFSFLQGKGLEMKELRARTKGLIGESVRFQSDHVGDSLALVTLAIADLAHGVEELYAQHPLVDGEFGLSREVVDVADERAHEFAGAWGSFRADGIDDVLGEAGVES
jgi:hypothetical protein